jgi:hypothetical protein
VPSIALEHLLLIGIEILFTSGFLLGLFRLRHKIGLVPFYTALAGMQQLQTLLALTVYIRIVPVQYPQTFYTDLDTLICK